MSLPLCNPLCSILLNPVDFKLNLHNSDSTDTIRVYHEVIFLDLKFSFETRFLHVKHQWSYLPQILVLLQIPMDHYVYVFLPDFLDLLPHIGRTVPDFLDLLLHICRTFLLLTGYHT